MSDILKFLQSSKSDVQHSEIECLRSTSSSSTGCVVFFKNTLKLQFSAIPFMVNFYRRPKVNGTSQLRGSNHQDFDVPISVCL